MTEVIKALTGNYAAAHAARLAKIGAGLFFPIGPADEVMETVRRFIDTGQLTGSEVLQLENEKETVSCQIGLARLGIRSMFSTCAEGMIWPASELKYASGSRLPLLIVNPSRSISPPTTMLCDHEDFVMQRDMGWLMFYCENPQDILDTVLQAYKIIEDRRVMLPAFVGYDGYGGISHASWRVSIPEQEKVDQFLPPRKLLPDKDYAKIDWYERFKNRRFQRIARDTYMDKKYVQRKALDDSKVVIQEVGSEFAKLFGREYIGLIETLHCEGAEVVIITMGALTLTARFVVNTLAKEGVKVGLIKLRTFRPFPKEALAEAVKDAKLVLTLEKNSLQALFTETQAALYRSEPKPLVMGRVVGMGGREFTYVDLAALIEEALHDARSGKVQKEFDWTPVWTTEFDPLEEDVGE